MYTHIHIVKTLKQETGSNVVIEMCVVVFFFLHGQAMKQWKKLLLTTNQN